MVQEGKGRNFCFPFSPQVPLSGPLRVERGRRIPSDEGMVAPEGKVRERNQAKGCRNKNRHC